MEGTGGEWRVSRLETVGRDAQKEKLIGEGVKVGEKKKVSVCLRALNTGVLVECSLGLLLAYLHACLADCLLSPSLERGLSPTYTED